MLMKVAIKLSVLSVLSVLKVLKVLKVSVPKGR